MGSKYQFNDFLSPSQAQSIYVPLSGGTVITGPQLFSDGVDLSGTDISGVRIIYPDVSHLTIIGGISSTGSIVASCGDSNNWCSTYTTVQASSAQWAVQSDLTELAAASGGWNSTETTVNANSASWADHFDATEVQVASGGWNSTETTVSSNSANWGTAFKNVLYLRYDNASNIGTQPGTFGTSLVAPSTWYITQFNCLYYVDPRDAADIGHTMNVIVPNASAENVNQVISFRKPLLTGNINNINISTVSGQNIGETPVFQLQQPGDRVQLVSTPWEFEGIGGAAGDGGTNYKWKQAWETRASRNFLTVSKNNVAGFESIRTAVSKIIDSSQFNPYTISVGPGFYYEDTITLPQFVSVVGVLDQSVTVVSLSGNDIFRLGDNCAVTNLSLSGANNAGAAAVRYPNSTKVGGVAFVENLIFQDCSIYVGILNNTGGSVALPTKLVVNDCVSETSVDKAFAVNQSNSGYPTIMVVNNYTHAVGPGVTVNDLFFSTGPGAVLGVFNSKAQAILGGVIKRGFRQADGSTVESHSNFMQGVTVGLSAENIGIAPVMHYTNTTLEGTVLFEIDIGHPTAVGYVGGTYGDSYRSESDNVRFTHVLNAGNGGFNVVGPLNHARDTEEDHLVLSDIIRTGTPLGLLSGGLVSFYTDLSVSVSAGAGYIQTLGVPDYIVLGRWSSTLVEVPSGTTRYVAYNTSTGIHLETSPPNLEENILLARVIAGSTDVEHIDRGNVDIRHATANIEESLRLGLGPYYRSGSRVTDGGNLTLNISQGLYYLGSKLYSLTEQVSGVWESFYDIGGGVFANIEGVSAVDVVYYNTSNTLAEITSGYYVKHALYALGGPDVEEYFFLYAQEEHASLSEARAGSLPTPPLFFIEGIVPIASLIVQASATSIAEIGDIRPRLGGGQVGSSPGGTNDHGSLLGLTDDDHVQYLLVNGTRAMAGNLNVGSNSITNVNLVDGVDVSDHSLRHEPGQVDALSLGLPVAIGVANNTGTGVTFVRNDHVHSHGQQTQSNLHALVTPTTHGFMASSDKGDFDSLYTTVNNNSAQWDESTDLAWLSGQIDVNTADITNIGGVSAIWDSAYTTVNANSSTWDDQADLTEIQAASGNWNSGYTSVNTTSGNWDAAYTHSTGDGSDHSDVAANTADITNIAGLSSTWDSAYTSVNTTSANWDAAYTHSTGDGSDHSDVAANTADISNMGSVSANWDTAYSHSQGDGSDHSDVAANTADLTNVASTSGMWNSSYTTVNANSAQWAVQSDLTEVAAASAGWNSTETTVNSNSANWDSAYTHSTGDGSDHSDVAANTADITNLASVSGSWDSSYTTVNSNSADWDAAYTHSTGDGSDHADVAANTADITSIAGISGNWDAAYTHSTGDGSDHSDVAANTANITNVASASGSWDSSYTTVNSNSANWDAAYTHSTGDGSDHADVAANTADITNIAGVSSTWDSVYTSVSPTSANWDSAYTHSTGDGSDHSDVAANTADITNIAGVSANWDAAYTHSTGDGSDHGDVAANTADITNIAAASGDWDSVHTTVNTNSADWQSAYSTVNSTSGAVTLMYWNSAQLVTTTSQTPVTAFRYLCTPGVGTYFVQWFFEWANGTKDKLTKHDVLLDGTTFLSRISSESIESDYFLGAGGFYVCTAGTGQHSFDILHSVGADGGTAKLRRVRLAVNRVI